MDTQQQEGVGVGGLLGGAAGLDFFRGDGGGTRGWHQW